MKKYLFLLMTIPALIACSTGKEDDNDGGAGVTAVTVGANHISAISVVLNGKTKLKSTASSDLQVGFQYSTSSGLLPSNSTSIEADDADSGYNYTSTITGLTPGTTYYFRSFVRQNGADTYGDTKEFTTKNLVSMLETQEATDIEASKATLNAKLDLTDVQYKNVAFGFLWENTESSLNIESKCTDIEDNAISASLTSLSHKTQYWYKAFVTLDNQTFHGEVKTFTTGIVSVESVALDKTEYSFGTIGNTLTLKASVQPGDATNKNIEWTSSDNNVATVTSTGLVKAVGNGTATITVRTEDQGKTASCAVTVAQLITSISLDKKSLYLNEGKEYTLAATIKPDNAANKTLKWTSSDESVATVDADGKVTAVAGGISTVKVEAQDGSGMMAICSVHVKSLVAPMGAVDLGLAVYWSTCNIGASAPERYGDYYAWGDRATKEYYGTSAYRFRNDSGLTKYNTSSSHGTVDNKTVLEPIDDVAHLELGGNWRMPTDTEWTELIENCTWTWEKIGFKGYKVTSNIPGYEDKSIFLPVAGYYNGSSSTHNGIVGFYWSSSLNTDNPYEARSCIFGEASVVVGNSGRSNGLSVRPVTE